MTSLPLRSPSVAHGRLIGLAVSLSLVLVALEWRLPARTLATWLDPLDPEASAGPWLEPPPMEPRTSASGPASAPRVVASAITTSDPALDDLGPDGSEGPAEPVPVDPATTAGTDAAATTTGPVVPWTPSASLPYLLDCYALDEEARNACTERGIRDVFTRRFRLPEGWTGRARTRLHFEVDTLGRIGRWRCVPRIDPALEREVERVLKAMPAFAPALQNGHRVAVPYSLPLSLGRW